MPQHVDMCEPVWNPPSSASALLSQPTLVNVISQVKCFELLLDAGAHPTAVDSSGRTAEMLAAECGQEGVRAAIAARAVAEREVSLDRADATRWLSSAPPLPVNHGVLPQSPASMRSIGRHSLYLAAGLLSRPGSARLR